ncbi:MAG: hypothetical protein ACWIPJ_09425 [Polaribacter sp.]
MSEKTPKYLFEYDFSMDDLIGTLDEFIAILDAANKKHHSVFMHYKVTYAKDKTPELITVKLLFTRRHCDVKVYIIVKNHTKGRSGMRTH